MTPIKCSNCGRELQENERPCPDCGCSARTYDESGLGVDLHISTGAKWKHVGSDGVRKTKGETKSTRQRDPRLCGQKVDTYLMVDEQNRKHHKVVDRETGRIIHEHTDPPKSRKRRGKNS